jgi:hypothetical protein
MEPIQDDRLTLHGRVTGPPHERVLQPGGWLPPDEVP